MGRERELDEGNISGAYATQKYKRVVSCYEKKVDRRSAKEALREHLRKKLRDSFPCGRTQKVRTRKKIREREGHPLLSGSASDTIGEREGPREYL